MSQLTLAPTDADIDRVSLSAGESFITVIGKDQPRCVHCADSAETLGTWYRPGEGSSAAAYQQ